MIYQIRLAMDDDLRDLISLRTEAEEWLRKAGIQQWVPQHREYSRRVMAEAVQLGNAWVVESPNGDIVATVTLNGADLDFWGVDDDPDSALYVSKLITARSSSGRDLGAAILNWAGDKAAESGRQFLRLDCRRDNDGLHRYYRAQGFRLVRIMNTPRNPNRKTFSGALFERQVTVRNNTGTKVIEVN